jgi:HKD family nuclease
MSRPLSKNWRNDLGSILSQCNEELTISSPYVSEAGIDFLLKNMNNKLKTNGSVNFITDLSPINIYQKATNPIAFQKLMENCSQIKLRHLPRLHAKVYVSDYSHAIITSGNLTAGGLFRNFEYGVELTNNEDVTIVKEDVESYSLLGAEVSLIEIKSYCKILEEVELSLIEKEKTARSESKEIFNSLFQKAEEKLVKLRLSEGAPHTVY